MARACRWWVSASGSASVSAWRVLVPYAVVHPPPAYALPPAVSDPRPHAVDLFTTTSFSELLRSLNCTDRSPTGSAFVTFAVENTHGATPGLGTLQRPVGNASAAMRESGAVERIGVLIRIGSTSRVNPLGRSAASPDLRSAASCRASAISSIAITRLYTRVDAAETQFDVETLGKACAAVTISRILLRPSLTSWRPDRTVISSGGGLLLRGTFHGMSCPNGNWIHCGAWCAPSAFSPTLPGCAGPGKLGGGGPPPGQCCG